MTRHRHRFTVSFWRGKDVGFRCRCGEERSRKMDREELRRCKAEMQVLRQTVRSTLGFAKRKLKDDIHFVGHDFFRRFKKDKGSGDWKYRGWELSKRVERWAEKWPGEVRLVHCDDSAFASSDLVLIEHRTESQYMGTTVVYIPQCTGEPPTEFFLYPNHRRGLVKALQEIGREAVLREKRERKVEAERRKWWAGRAVPDSR